MQNWQVDEENHTWQQFTDSTTWDTAMYADLLTLGGQDAHIRSIVRASEYLASNQTEHQGDWSARTRTPRGGAWSFQRTGIWYPDCDDTAFVSRVLLNADAGRFRKCIQNGIEWLLAMQCSSGGWASWDRNDRSWIRIPNAGKWFARDLESVDITARVLILFFQARRLRDFLPRSLATRVFDASERAQDWLVGQYRGGSWYGAWFTHFLYGTCLAVEALSKTKPELLVALEPEILHWLERAANNDGGFGESPLSGQERSFVSAPSTPFHTACGLHALTNLGHCTSDSATSSVAWLLKNQERDGSWRNRDFFAAGIPGHWYANFSHMPTYLATKALSEYQRAKIGVERTC